MPDAADRIVAIKLVIDRVQPDDAPVLTRGQVELEVDRAKIASEWLPNTVYQVGALVVPPVRNGHSYRVVQGGTSGAVLAASAYALGLGSRFYDGNSNPVLTWQESGTDRFNGGIPGFETGVYDIGLASQQLWAIKERMAAQFVADGDVSFEQLYEHCKEQRTMFRPFRFPMRLAKG